MYIISKPSNFYVFQITNLFAMDHQIATCKRLCKQLQIGGFIVVYDFATSADWMTDKITNQQIPKMEQAENKFSPNSVAKIALVLVSAIRNTDPPMFERFL